MPDRVQDSARRYAYAAVLLALGLAGCGPSGPTTYAVSGRVTFDGEPIADGYITFAPAVRGEAPAAAPIKAGAYRLRTTAGEKRVSVQASKFVGPENPVMGLRAREQYIPDRYNLETTLTAGVTADGANEFDFALLSSEPESTEASSE